MKSVPIAKNELVDLNLDSYLKKILSLSERKDKCQLIRDNLKNETLILLRAARGSGKTIMCQLLKRFLLNQEKDDPESLQVEHVFVIDLIDASGYQSLESYLEEITGYPNLISINKNLKNCVLIFDESQKLYGKDYNSFWDSIKGLIQGNFKNIKAFMVASYSPKDLGTWTSPPELTQAAALSLSFLYCSKKEMEELNNHFNQHSKVRSSLFIDEEIRDTILEFTGGHIGLISTIYSHLYHKFLNTSPLPSKSVTKKEIFHYFYSSDNLKALETYRSFNELDRIDEEKKELLRKLYFAGILQSSYFPDNHLSDLLKMGVIDYTQPNSKEVTWSFGMMTTYLMPYLFSSAQRPLINEFQDKYKGSLNSFIWDALERYSTKQLKDGIGKTTEYLKEQHVVVEFYRVISSLVPKEFSLILEEGKDKGIGQKRLDFYINDTTQWAIQFLVETNDPVGHAQRFEGGGSYARAQKKNHAVIHFVSHHHKNHQRAAEAHGVWRVELGEHCKTAQVSPWIRENSDDVGVRGEKRKIIFKGDLDHYPPTKMPLPKKPSKRLPNKKN